MVEVSKNQLREGEFYLMYGVTDDSRRYMHLFKQIDDVSIDIESYHSWYMDAIKETKTHHKFDVWELGHGYFSCGDGTDDKKKVFFHLSPHEVNCHILIDEL